MPTLSLIVGVAVLGFVLAFTREIGWYLLERYYRRPRRHQRRLQTAGLKAGDMIGRFEVIDVHGDMVLLRKGETDCYVRKEKLGLLRQAWT